MLSRGPVPLEAQLFSLFCILKQKMAPKIWGKFWEWGGGQKLSLPLEGNISDFVV